MLKLLFSQTYTLNSLAGIVSLPSGVKLSKTYIHTHMRMVPVTADDVVENRHLRMRLHPVNAIPSGVKSLAGWLQASSRWWGWHCLYWCFRERAAWEETYY